MLRDSAHIQEKDTEFVTKRFHRRRSLDPTAKDGAVQPLYTAADAEATLPLFRPVALHATQELGPGAAYQTVDAGHMLGSSAVVVTERVNGKELRLGFSGDLGHPGLPIIRDPEPLPPVDWLILESTYGGRLHRDNESVIDKLANVVSRTCARGGKIIVPSFAVGRTQQLVLLLHELFDNGRIPKIPIFVDSPLAVETHRGLPQTRRAVRSGSRAVRRIKARTPSVSSACATSAMSASRKRSMTCAGHSW